MSKNRWKKSRTLLFIASLVAWHTLWSRSYCLNNIEINLIQTIFLSFRVCLLQIKIKVFLTLNNLDYFLEILGPFVLAFFVIPTLNVSRKFSMCIIFSTGYIKIYNINSSNEYFIQQYAFVQSSIQYNSSKTYEIHP